MLKITIPKQEYWDARTQEFVQLNIRPSHKWLHQ